MDQNDWPTLIISNILIIELFNNCYYRKLSSTSDWLILLAMIYDVTIGGGLPSMVTPSVITTAAIYLSSSVPVPGPYHFPKTSIDSNNVTSSSSSSSINNDGNYQQQHYHRHKLRLSSTENFTEKNITNTTITTSTKMVVIGDDHDDYYPHHHHHHQIRDHRTHHSLPTSTISSSSTMPYTSTLFTSTSAAAAAAATSVASDTVSGTSSGHPGNFSPSTSTVYTYDDETENDLFQQYSRNQALDTPILVSLIILYAVLIFIGAFGNGLVCLAVARNPRMRTPQNLFIVNLAISDLILCFFTIPFSLFEIATKFWPYGVTMCKLVLTLEGISIYVSTMSIIAIALDRYHVILRSVNPDQRRRSGTPIILKLILIWVIGIILALPLFLVRTVESHFIGMGPIDMINFCIEKWPIHYGRAYYSVCSMLIQYVVPIIIVTVVYTRLCIKLRSRTMRRTSTTQLPKLRTRLQKRARKTNVLLISIALIFFISWLPLNVLNIVADFFFPVSSFRITFAICHMFGMSSACSNPFLYGWLNQTFRNEFKQIFDSFKRCFFRIFFHQQLRHHHGAGSGGVGSGGSGGLMMGCAIRHSAALANNNNNGRIGPSAMASSDQFYSTMTPNIIDRGGYQYHHPNGRCPSSGLDVDNVVYNHPGSINNNPSCLASGNNQQQLLKVHRTKNDNSDQHPPNQQQQQKILRKRIDDVEKSENNNKKQEENDNSEKFIEHFDHDQKIDDEKITTCGNDTGIRIKNNKNFRFKRLSLVDSRKRKNRNNKSSQPPPLTGSTGLNEN